MKRILSVMTGVTLVAALSSAGSAQVAITPLVGGYVPGSSLKDVRSGAQTVAVERDGTLGLGLNVDMGMLRASLAYASGTTIRNAEREDIGKGNVVAVAADLVVRPLPRIFVQPYILGGAGLKNLSYDRDDGIVTGLFPEDRRELSLHAGIGADVMLGPIGVVAELTDFISRDADDKWKVHDAFLMAGLKIRL
jgi:hypothetical protein